MLILKNANIHTHDRSRPRAHALAVRDGRIVDAGETGDLLSRYGDRAEIEDLEGRTVLPGLTDAHVHFKNYALSLRKVNCETRTLAECLDNIRARVRETPPGTWILGHGWQQNDWPDCTGGVDGFPGAGMLDGITMDHPVYLTAKSLHAGWANSRAMDAAGLSVSSEDPPDGAVQRAPDGAPTGILLEGAMRLVAGKVPRPSEMAVRAALLEAQQELWKLGLTGIHDFDRRECFAALQQIHAEGHLKLRVVKNIPVEDLDAATAIGLRSGFGDDMLRIGNIKAFVDGALGPHTAAMIRPYDDDPVNRGMLLLDAEEIFETGRKAVTNGLAMTLHAIGDLANHEVLGAYERLRTLEKEKGLPELRHRIEHVQLLHPDDLNKLSELRVIASMQPVHATSDMFAADRFWGDRARHAYAWRTLIDAGTRMAFGSDAPVESPNPFPGLHAAVTRRRIDGSPGPEGWYPAQRVSRVEALDGFTSGAAYAAGMEDRLGKLAPGYYADLVVLDEDFFGVPPERIPHLAPEGTMVNGEWVYRR